MARPKAFNPEAVLDTAVARLLVNVSIGLRIQAKISPNRTMLTAIVATALSTIG